MERDQHSIVARTRDALPAPLRTLSWIDIFFEYSGLVSKNSRHFLFPPTRILVTWASVHLAARRQSRVSRSQRSQIGHALVLQEGGESELPRRSRGVVLRTIVRDRTNEMWTPSPRWAPEQVRQQKTPNESEAHWERTCISTSYPSMQSARWPDLGHRDWAREHDSQSAPRSHHTQQHRPSERTITVDTGLVLAPTEQMASARKRRGGASAITLS